MANLQRGRFHGAGQILRYNWPWYAGAVVLSAMCAALLLVATDALTVAILILGVVMPLLSSATSLAASHWVYDRSDLYRWEWLASVLGRPPSVWVNIHSGLDETTAALKGIFPESKGVSVDIFEASTMTEASIRRARKLTAGGAASVCCNHAALPFGPGELDAVFLLFAAHELRQPRQREALFSEVSRILKPGARAVVVEHARDLANFIAFGPGVFHFLPAAEWLRVFGQSQLRLDAHFRKTPFVRVFVLSR